MAKVLELTEPFITKSAVDLETVSLSEDETDSEIENEGSVEPEYDTLNYDEEDWDQ